MFGRATIRLGIGPHSSLQYFSTCLLDVMNGIQPTESYSSYCRDFFEGLCVTWSSCREEYCLNKTGVVYVVNKDLCRFVIIWVICGTFVFLSVRSWRHCPEAKNYSGLGQLCR